MLGSGDNEEIRKMFHSLQLDASAIVNSVIELVYYMRGSIQYDDMMFRTPGERDLFGQFIEKRLEIESKSLNPNY